jgi:N4-gp56 family major capsid protein
MALTTARTGLTPQLWDDQFFAAYIRANQFSAYMGTDENSIIQLREELTKKKGDSITFALVNELTDSGVTGNTTLEGNEEALDARSHKVTVAPLRHAVAVTDWDEQKSAIDLRNAGKTMLKMWAMTKMRDAIISAFGSINGVAYASASEGQKDAWLVDNADRVLFGAAKANAVSNDHSTALGLVDSTTDVLSPGIVSLAKRMAKTASPKIRPIMVDRQGEWYVMFVPSVAFRDLKTNATYAAALADARERGKDNPLFVDGDLMWDGVIVREIPEIATITGVGGSSIDVAPCYLCGAQAVGVGWAQRTKSVTQMRDYDFVNGVGVSEIRGIEKLIFGSGAADTDDLKQNGVVTVYVSGVADA